MPRPHPADARLRDGILSRANGTLAVLQAAEPTNGSASFLISYTINEKVGAKEAAEARGDAVAAQMAPDAEVRLSRFEGATGWRHSGGPEWHAVLLHGD